jgi:DNA-directed RNA polymerase subunit M/transcription elongation factor TFIIS
MSLPQCPKCGRTDYRLEYDRDRKRTGYRICNRCGHRWLAEWAA